MREVDPALPQVFVTVVSVTGRTLSKPVFLSKFVLFARPTVFIYFILISISLYMLLQIFVKILLSGRGIFPDLVDTSSVSSNPANPENGSEGQAAELTRRKRQCAPLNLREPNLVRQVWQGLSLCFEKRLALLNVSH